ncbi:MAG: aldo/keto reductase [Phycisphaerae bacterium]|nr:aldo/keto reductase [Phycisphaerae bacterium]
MNNRRIPGTDLCVSPICLGTMTYGAPVGEAGAIRLTHWAIDHGINFIDTANMYEGYARYAGSSGGVAEEILGKAIRGRRDQVVLATKVGMKVGDDPDDDGTSPSAIRRQLDKSLARLGADFVDIYYLHRPDPDTPLVEIVGVLDEAIRSGKIRHYGLSNYPADLLAEMLKVADENNLPRPVIHQPPYSLLKRDVAKDLLPLCRTEEIGVAPYQVLQGGLLTGKYRRGQPLPTNSRKAEKNEWVWELTDEIFDQLEQIEAEAKAKDRTMLQHAVLSVLAQPGVVSVVMGVKRIEQLETLARIVEG